MILYRDVKGWGCKMTGISWTKVCRQTFPVRAHLFLNPKQSLETCRPKIIREQWCDTLMPFYKHYPIDSLLVLREGYLYFHNGLRESSTLSTLMFILDNLGSHHTAIHKRTICIARSACGQLCSLLRPATALSGCANWHDRSPRYPEKPGRFVSCARSDGPCPR